MADKFYGGCQYPNYSKICSPTQNLGGYSSSLSNTELTVNGTLRPALVPIIQSEKMKIAKAPVLSMRKMKEISKDRHLQDDSIGDINT